MILQALNRYYDRARNEAENEVPPYGFSVQRISFCVVLEPDGTLYDIHDLRVPDGRRLKPVSLALPHPGGKRTSGIRPYFLWDKTDYVFGRNADTEAQGNKRKEDLLRKAFAAFRKLHLAMQERIQSEPYAAVCRFLEDWDPTQADALPYWPEMSGQNLVFLIRATSGYVHEDPEVREAWARFLESRQKGPVARCLITNELAPIARTHAPIRNVRGGGGKADKSIVSFNEKAFESYGKDQAYNAPVSQR
ncbi:MAG: type I-C CRISPR-associated protein Cas8c/Csd1, partial [bacterium]